HEAQQVVDYRRKIVATRRLFAFAVAALIQGDNSKPKALGEQRTGQVPDVGTGADPVDQDDTATHRSRAPVLIVQPQAVSRGEPVRHRGHDMHFLPPSGGSCNRVRPADTPTEPAAQCAVRTL